MNIIFYKQLINKSTKQIMGGAHPTSQKNLRLTCLSIATSKLKPLISTQQELKDNM